MRSCSRRSPSGSTGCMRMPTSCSRAALDRRDLSRLAWRAGVAACGKGRPRDRRHRAGPVRAGPPGRALESQDDRFLHRLSAAVHRPALGGRAAVGRDVRRLGGARRGVGFRLGGRVGLGTRMVHEARSGENARPTVRNRSDRRRLMAFFGQTPELTGCAPRPSPPRDVRRLSARASIDSVALVTRPIAMSSWRKQRWSVASSIFPRRFRMTSSADPPGFGPKIEYTDHQQSSAGDSLLLSRAQAGRSARRAGLGGRARAAFHPQRHASRRALALSSDDERGREGVDDRRGSARMVLPARRQARLPPFRRRLCGDRRRRRGRAQADRPHIATPRHRRRQHQRRRRLRRARLSWRAAAAWAPRRRSTCSSAACA